MNPDKNTDMFEDSSTLSEVFHENSKIFRALIANLSNIPTSLNQDQLIELSSTAFKQYSTAESKSLLTGKSIDQELSNLFKNRRSKRDMTDQNIGFSELSDILFLSAGITKINPIDEDRNHFLRAYPSAGGMYPLEIYPIIFKCDDIDPGLYHYNVKENSLKLLDKGDHREKTSKMILESEIVSKCSVAIIITAFFSRTTIKYGHRGYRFILIESGHLAQNIYLTCTALGLACTGIGGFVDDEINAFLNIDGTNEAAVYSLLIGK